MKPQFNLSPLAFEILKFLCNSAEPESYQTISKDMLGVEDPHAFDQAIAELQSENLIEIGKTSDTNELSEDYTKYITDESTSNTHHTAIISARISNNQGNICDEMDYYIAAQRDTDV